MMARNSWIYGVLILIFGASETRFAAAQQIAKAETTTVGEGALAVPGRPQPGSGLDLGPADLSICGEGGKKVIVPPASPNLEDYARRLHGTWLLRTRTIQGITIDTDSKFYFDLASITPEKASGYAMMIDRGNLLQLDPMKTCPACVADASVGALWKVTITPRGTSGVFLSMAGEYLGSYGDFVKGMTATEEAAFYRNGDTYVGGNLVSPAGGAQFPDDNWDRIGLTKSVLTYVSCRSGFVDRFEKISDEVPRPDGKTLPESWAISKSDGSLINPPHVRFEGMRLNSKPSK